MKSFRVVTLSRRGRWLAGAGALSRTRGTVVAAGIAPVGRLVLTVRWDGWTRTEKLSAQLLREAK